MILSRLVLACPVSCVFVQWWGGLPDWPTPLFSGLLSRPGRDRLTEIGVADVTYSLLHDKFSTVILVQINSPSLLFCFCLSKILPITTMMWTLKIDALVSQDSFPCGRLWLQLGWLGSSSARNTQAGSVLVGGRLLHLSNRTAGLMARSALTLLTVH